MSSQARFSTSNGGQTTCPPFFFPHAQAAMFGRLLDTLRPARFRISVSGNYWRVFPASQGKNKSLGSEGKRGSSAARVGALRTRVIIAGMMRVLK